MDKEIVEDRKKVDEADNLGPGVGLDAVGNLGLEVDLDGVDILGLAAALEEAGSQVGACKPERLD